MLDPSTHFIHPAATMINATPQQLRKAADIQERILALQAELNQILSGDVPASVAAAEVPKKKKRRMGAAGRAAIAAGARARWAKLRAAKGGVKPMKKARRKISAAGKARLSALAKARWAKAKRAGKTTL